jgi:hypothetical protein
VSQQETRKVAKIVGEMLNYLFRRGYSRVNFFVRRRESETKIKLELPNVKAIDLKEMIDKIGKEKDPEIEMYGWELVGESGYKDQLDVLGVLIDSVEVEETEEKLILTFTRIKSSDQH